VKNVVVLGGYGNFGKSSALVESLKDSVSASLNPLVIDIFAEDFKEQLTTISPYLVIHTSGPFQGQDYRVPKACIECGAHYIDLADDRRFVCDIGELDQQAKDKGVLIVSGASSVPGVSQPLLSIIKISFAS